MMKLFPARAQRSGEELEESVDGSACAVLKRAGFTYLQVNALLEESFAVEPQLLCCNLRFEKSGGTLSIRLQPIGGMMRSDSLSAARVHAAHCSVVQETEYHPQTSRNVLDICANTFFIFSSDHRSPHPVL